MSEWVSKCEWVSKWLSEYLSGSSTAIGGAVILQVSSAPMLLLLLTLSFWLVGPSALFITRSAMRHGFTLVFWLHALFVKKWYIPMLEKCSNELSACQLTAIGSLLKVGSSFSSMSPSLKHLLIRVRLYWQLPTCAFSLADNKCWVRIIIWSFNSLMCARASVQPASPLFHG